MLTRYIVDLDAGGELVGSRQNAEVPAPAHGAGDAAALDALAAKGFHGETDNATIKIKDDSGVTAGKVTSLKLTGIHDCCGSCNKAIKTAIKSVDGVKRDTARAKNNRLTVDGNFDAAEVVKALNAAGFHVKVEP